MTADTTLLAQADVVAQVAELAGAEPEYVESLYLRWLKNPQSVDPEWQQLFAAVHDDPEAVERDVRGPSWARADWPPRPADDLIAALDYDWSHLEAEMAGKIRAAGWKSGEVCPPDELKARAKDSVRALMLIRAYRVRGHLIADLDPLRLREPEPHPELRPETYGFRTPEDRKRTIYLDGVLGLDWGTIDDVLAILKRTYCGRIGWEFMHIADPQQKAWIQERIEGPDKEIEFTSIGKKTILERLIQAEEFERFLHRKYIGTKRFSLEGAESIIPALEQVIKRGGQLGVRTISMGMAHRGRLNVLANVMGKPYRAIFSEFTGEEPHPDETVDTGDVKYHLGASSDRTFDNNEVHISLASNPSHLEIVDPVVLGKARALQDSCGDVERTHIMPLLIHGDAAFAGQGVVAECFALSGVSGHRTGGSVHFIINNQIGFTTSPIWGRSSPYPSDVAKMAGAPIIHVNGDDPEAVVFAARVATEFRQAFGKPVVVDMFCYRRHGHNEADEPSFTQPLMYRRIAEHPTVVEIYGRQLVREGLVSEEEVQAMRRRFRALLEREFEAAESWRPAAHTPGGLWRGYRPPAITTMDDPRPGQTGVDEALLRKVGEAITRIPESFHIHPTLKRIVGARRKAVEEGHGIDWATAEQLAFGTLLMEGYRVRLSGQDVRRGTFSQRHAVWIDQQTDEPYVPLNHIDENQPQKADFIDSILSEEAVLGFEYGYSVADPGVLVIWEAQFGDFANGAQVVFDQFISSAERKWHRMSGITCLLPHGFEGQGPEHSSARMERFLQLCAQDNMQVANCTTPANYFHILRRQMKRDFRKPLILFTPKSLLRHPLVVSNFADMGPHSAFCRTLTDDAERRPETTSIRLVPDDRIRRVILCTGKIYYDLFAEREKRGIDDIYLMRIEQLYPFPHRLLVSELERFAKQAEFVWCQEEPWNMGAWNFVEHHLEWVLTTIDAKQKRPAYVGRPASASPATGYYRKHLKEQQSLLEQALGEEPIVGRAWGSSIV